MIRWCWPWELRKRGILGMNRRNSRYIGSYNERRHYPLVDNKLKSKQLAEAAGIAVPKLLGVVHSQHDASHALELLQNLNDFVIKPAQGSGGKGILVIVAREGEQFIKPSGERLSIFDIERDLSNILGGLYSLGGKPDVAMIEARVEFDPVFDNYSYEGVPDIRVITLRGYPVMAMLRLATHASDGKANLHQGAVGVGLDLANGRGLNAVQFGRPVSHHPDTGTAFDKLQVPHWQQILELAASCYEVTELGYMGCDIVLDRDLGPLILEMNARPGLAIQIANDCGLTPRLQQIEQRAPHTASVTERVAYAIEQFGHG
ncbi:alpha-L-glutamate ligase-like protein [Marinobacterium arenosum]|uniref:alpha-L-glutamate ligase-like protein n=1 Tax=Marinobacterium arenosum TaxID=2862496 RepID=UPI001C970BAB|nr:alpha-L-glutamate ligase-like protein [Marinobacterium arenosum]MBY4678796.1 alpha-L-glutamate ligase-like protein [Marinobacterium arenosum]